MKKPAGMQCCAALRSGLFEGRLGVGGLGRADQGGVAKEGKIKRVTGRRSRDANALSAHLFLWRQLVSRPFGRETARPVPAENQWVSAPLRRDTLAARWPRPYPGRWARTTTTFSPIWAKCDRAGRRRGCVPCSSFVSAAQRPARVGQAMGLRPAGSTSVDVAQGLRRACRGATPGRLIEHLASASERGEWRSRSGS